MTANAQHSAYGGDAYTEIQNAAADTEHAVVAGSNTVAELAADLDEDAMAADDARWGHLYDGLATCTPCTASLTGLHLGSGVPMASCDEPLGFERPFWAGEFPAVEDDDEYPFPFHPLELAEAGLDDLFGFVFEGYTGMAGDSVDPFDITLAGFRLG